MGVLVGGAFRQLRAIIPGCGSFFSPLPPREKKNDRIALERRYFDEEIFLLFEDWALAKAIYKSSSVGSLHRYFSSLLVLTDKMAFTCRHVLILDRGRRLPATIAPDFSVASRAATFFYYSRKDVRSYAAAALSLCILYIWIPPRLVHFTFHRRTRLDKGGPHLAIISFLTHNFSRSRQIIEIINFVIDVRYNITI